MKINISKEKLQQRKLMVAVPMYGGQCLGMFTRSMIDLTALCNKYGVSMGTYFLFNESLITRARNYCADEFMRSDCTHLLFIDSDIGFDANDVLAMLALQSDNPEDDDYDIVAGPYPKKCLDGSTTLFTKNGKQTIASIVKQRYTGEVLSYGTNGLEWKQVTNHWSEKNPGKKWVGLSTSVNSEESSIAPRSKMIVTDDHEVGVIRNPLNPVVEYIPAKSTKGLYLVQTPKQVENNKNSSARVPLLSSERVSALVGAALGDGHISDTGTYMGNHGSDQLEYNKHKHDIMGGRFSTYQDHNMLTLKNGQTQYLRDILYCDGIKTIENVLAYNLLDAIGLAFLYMDDGNRYYYPEPVNQLTSEKTWWYNDRGDTVRCASAPDETWQRGRKADAWKPTSSLATMSFTYKENQQLVQYIKDRFDVDAYIYKAGDKFGIKFDADNTDKLHSLIAPYVPECMEYKLNDSYRGGTKHVFDSANHDVAASLIRHIVDVESDSYLYDIEVEDNHNFFVNDGALVHNCISWEKIVAAVDKGFADDNPNNLERFVGDYVFNPEKGGEIPLFEPVPVLEAGTGFMMIRRNTFERFEQKYPQFRYKPDHVRTEHFDGTREIMAYFDALIDDKSQNLVPEIEAFYDQNPKATKEQVIEFLADKKTGIDRQQYSNRYLSEDYMFCQWVRNAGMKVWLCPWMKLQHVGSYVFGGSMVDLAQIGVTPTADAEVLKKTKGKKK